MTDDEIEAIRARLASSTPGPWKASTDDAGDVVVWGPDEDWLANVGNWARQHPGIDADAAARQFVETRDAADATLIAHAPTDLAALCDEVERLRAWLLRGGKLTDEELKALKPWRRRLGIVGNDNSVTYNGDDIVSVARVPLDDDVARLIEEQNALLDEVIRLRAGLARTDLAWDRLQDAVIVQERNALTTRAEKAEASAAAGWRGLQNIASMLGTECAEGVALGMATSAAGRMVAERDALKARVAVLVEALHRAADHIDSVPPTWKAKEPTP